MNNRPQPSPGVPSKPGGGGVFPHPKDPHPLAPSPTRTSTLPGEGKLWPGNVRELANAVERATVLVDEDELIRPEDLPEAVLEAASAAGRLPVTRFTTP
ncbi:MAG TPA: hypothetical protein VEW48_12670 [Thermoanaerobaculia bacterium]|nr:hypothetical protein [Thermoanaerobaculia bacterium]